MKQSEDETTNLSLVEFLNLARRIQQEVIKEEYDGVEGFLGERYLEEKRGMTKEKRGTEGFGGWIGEWRIQSKFKWIDNPKNLGGYYVNISEESKSKFDILSITHASRQNDNIGIRELGMWKFEDLPPPRYAYRPKQIYLLDIVQKPQFIISEHSLY